MESLGKDFVLTGDEDKPFAYATPRPLTPLYTPSHPRARIAEQMFGRLLGVSVMNDAVLRRTSAENRHAGRKISSAATRGFHNGSNLFSTTLEEVQPPRMAMHLERPEGPVRVAFVATQQPSESEGRVVFGDQATAMYKDIVALHQKNIHEERGAEYVYQAITGQSLRA